MKKILLFTILTVSLMVASSCKKDDDTSTSEYPKTVNIKYEVVTDDAVNPDYVVETTINNDTDSKERSDLPFNLSFTQIEVNKGSYLKLSYRDESIIAVGTGGSSTWKDYNITLNIYVDNEVVKTESFLIAESSGNQIIEYTF